MKYRFSFAMCLIILTLFNLGEAKELKNKVWPFGSSEEEINDIEGEDLPDQNVFEKELNNQQLQTIIQEAKLKDISNCPLCAMGNDNNKNRIWELREMDADHVTAWSKGGLTDIDNCQMLCQTHNRAKGNR